MATEWDEFNQRIIDEFRANAGTVGPPFDGAPMILLTTTGARSGEPRVAPLVCREDGDGTIYIFASKAGAPAHPAWYHNLVTNPTVTVEHGADRFEAVATTVTGGERDAIYEAHAANFPNFAEYQEKTSRLIPVVALRRA